MEPSHGIQGEGGQTPLEASLDNVQHNKEETTLHLWNGAALGPQKTNQPTSQQTNKKKRGCFWLVGWFGVFLRNNCNRGHYVVSKQ